jgi:hypothetical protein
MNRDLLEFVQSSFRSIWSLELLIYLRGHPERAWSQEELVRELRGSLPVVEQGTAMLQAAGLVAAHADGGVRYAPASPDLDRLAADAERAYREKPSEVRRAILAAPSDKLQSLADAFRIRKD